MLLKIVEYNLRKYFSLTRSFSYAPDISVKNALINLATLTFDL